MKCNETVTFFSKAQMNITFLTFYKCDAFTVCYFAFPSFQIKYWKMVYWIFSYISQWNDQPHTLFGHNSPWRFVSRTSNCITTFHETRSQFQMKHPNTKSLPVGLSLVQKPTMHHPDINYIMPHSHMPFSTSHTYFIRTKVAH